MRAQKKLELGIYNAQFLKLVPTKNGGLFRLKFLVLDGSQETCECIATCNTLSLADLNRLFEGKSVDSMAHTQWRVRVAENDWNDLLTIAKFQKADFVYPKWFITYFENWQGSKNGERDSQVKKDYLASRTAQDLKFSATLKAREILNKGLRGELSHPEAVYYFGCGTAELRFYIETQFQPGWTWQNRGNVWHLAHLKPLAKMDLLDIDVFRAANHVLNLQPQSREKNMADYCN